MMIITMIFADNILPYNLRVKVIKKMYEIYKARIKFEMTYQQLMICPNHIK